MSLLTNQLSEILTPKGFYNTVKQLTPELPLEMAYEEAERTHIAITGNPRYPGGFSSFDRVKKRYDQKRE
ncbi:hypothetical protein [Spirosoma foliorum]|uniref:Uncharacterized protein n=1 Tax=Spirosoma foliorum TaxID=2710596 RepID=A0A7G5H2I2_9BACT|nr:hypothetical protein [Spirosoma foliorum]QMW05324.1 hypothetical protein H3H32_10765 [Spirosoma foliorum]